MTFRVNLPTCTLAILGSGVLERRRTGDFERDCDRAGAPFGASCGLSDARPRLPFDDRDELRERERLLLELELRLERLLDELPLDELYRERQMN